MPFFFHIGTVRLSSQSVYCVISSGVLDKSVPSDVVLLSSILRCKTSWIQNFGSHLFAFQCSNGMLSVSVAFFDFVCLNLSSTSIMLIRRIVPNVGSACINGWWASSVEIWPKYLHYLSVAARQSVSKIPALSLTQHKYWTSCVRGYRLLTSRYTLAVTDGEIMASYEDIVDLRCTGQKNRSMKDVSLSEWRRQYAGHPPCVIQTLLHHGTCCCLLFIRMTIRVTGDDDIVHLFITVIMRFWK